MSKRMSKQDRTHTRTAAQLEEKYDLGQTFGSVSQQVAEAKRAAAAAESAASSLNNKLSQESTLARLTNSGAAPAIFLIDGQLYIHASYIKQGVIKSADGEKIVIDLDNGTVSFADINAVIEEINTKIKTLRQELVDKGLLESEE